MRLTLRLSPSLIHDADNQLEYVLNGSTIDECMQKVKDSLPEIKAKLWQEGRLNPQILLFHNNTLIRENHFSKVVKESDVLDVIPAIEGG